MEKFGENIKIQEEWDQKIELWNSIINDSVLTEEAKKKFIDLLGKQRQLLFNRQYATLEDWVYFTIHQLADLTYGAIKSGEDSAGTRAVFENIRADIWDFYRKLNNPD